MRKMLLPAVAAALLAAPLKAQPRVAAVDASVSAPAPGLGAAASPAVDLAPALIAGAPLSAPSLSAPALAAAPAALPAAALPVAAIPGAPAPAEAPALLPSKPGFAAAAAGPKPAPGSASADAPDVSGRAFFDQAAEAPARPLSEIVAQHSSRTLRNVFIQQEHEGNLLAPDSRDSSGNVFRYYKPVEMRPALAAAVDGTLTGFSKFVYSVRRFLQFGGRSAPDAAWRAWPLQAKLEYLDRLEAAVVAERGPHAAWNGKVSLILERKDGAPDFVTRNPHMESPPGAPRGVAGARYLLPEIVSDKKHPAASVAEALGRAKRIIADTGHAGVQFHVFVKAAPEELLAQMESLDGTLQLVNDVMFAKAAASSDKNIALPALRPWHNGSSQRVRELLTKAEAGPHVPQGEDLNSEKHSFVGFRYWGMEDGKAVVSLELRGTSMPWKQQTNTMVQGLEAPTKAERDYSEARAYLTFLALYAEALARGSVPRVPASSVVIDEKAADAALHEAARELGMPLSAYDGQAAFVRRLTGSAGAPQAYEMQGYLFPFAASPADSPELRTFANEAVLLAARLKASEEAGREENMPHARYLFWLAYKEWAESFGARQDARLADLVRAVSR
ncbi:MAG: hypothetical protein ACHQ49_17070 [Elusimicrobiota bacterium]